VVIFDNEIYPFDSSYPSGWKILSAGKRRKGALTTLAAGDKTLANHQI
jgi:hypothetical protein